MLKCIYPTIYTNNVYTERQAANTKTTGYSAGFQWQNSTNLAKVAVITGQLLGAKKFSIAKFFWYVPFRVPCNNDAAAA